MDLACSFAGIGSGQPMNLHRIKWYTDNGWLEIYPEFKMNTVLLFYKQVWLLRHLVKLTYRVCSVAQS